MRIENMKASRGRASRSWLIGAAVVALSLEGAAAHSQAAAPPESGATDGFADIVVTARRREERLQDVPIAVTAVTGAALASKGVTDVQQLNAVIPSLQVAPTARGPSVPGFTVRGQRQLEGLLTQDTSVGVYFADVVAARPHGTNQSFYDIESVQVLKGPQGTLFGRNTTGGAILIQPVKPSFKANGFVTLTGGNYELRSVTAAVNVPLDDQFAIRIAGKVGRRDGYSRNLTTGIDLNNEKVDAFRFGVLWDAGERFNSYTLVDYVHYRDNGFAYALTFVNPAIAALQGLFPGVNAARDRQLARRDIRDVENDSAGRDLARTLSIFNTSEFDLGELTLKNIFGYRHVNSEVNPDYDGSPLPIFGLQSILRTTQISNELQVLGKAFDDRLQYIGGAYYFRERGIDEQFSVVFGRPAISRGGKGRNTSRSLFGQLDYKLLDRLTLTGGYRYTWDKRRFTFDSLGPNLASCALLGANLQPLDPCRKPVGKSFSDDSYLMTLSYKPFDRTMVYATHSTGYRSGGFNIRGILAEETSLPVGPEKVKNYEAGIKSSIAGGLLSFNGAVYRSDYSDIQRSVGVPCTSAVVCSVVLNAATARIEGAEGEVYVRPARWLNITGFVGYTDASYKRFITPTGQDFSSNRFAFVPKYTWGLSAAVSAPLGEDDSNVGELSVNYYHQSRMFINDSNDGGPIPGYGYWNLSGGVSNIAGSKFSARIFVNNLTDKDYITTAQATNSSVGTFSVQYGAPRTYGLSISYGW